MKNGYVIKKLVQGRFVDPIDEEECPIFLLSGYSTETNALYALENSNITGQFFILRVLNKLSPIDVKDVYFESL